MSHSRLTGSLPPASAMKSKPPHITVANRCSSMTNCSIIAFCALSTCWSPSLQSKPGRADPSIYTCDCCSTTSCRLLGLQLCCCQTLLEQNYLFCCKQLVTNHTATVWWAEVTYVNPRTVQKDLHGQIAPELGNSSSHRLCLRLHMCCLCRDSACPLSRCMSHVQASHNAARLA